MDRVETHSDRRRSAGEGPIAVGLTGGLAAGKTTALCLFAEAGAVTASADAVVHELYGLPDMRAALREHFGAGVLSADGTVDHGALGMRVAADREALRWLEGLVHPRVSQEFDRLLAATDPGRVVVIEIPLLFESGLQRLFDLVVTVEAPREVRSARAEVRDGGRVFGALDAEQLASEQRLAASDICYVNDGDPAGLRGFVAEVMARTRAVRRAPTAGTAVS